jgi:hypothetical protein
MCGCPLCLDEDKCAAAVTIGIIVSTAYLPVQVSAVRPTYLGSARLGSNIFRLWLKENTDRLGLFSAQLLRLRLRLTALMWMLAISGECCRLTISTRRVWNDAEKLLALYAATSLCPELF